MYQKFTFCFLTLLTICFFTGCSNGTSKKNELTEFDINYLKSIADRDGELVVGKQWDTLAAQYAKDAVRHPPNGSPIRGQDSIRQWYNFLPPVKSFHFRMDELNGDGTYAYMRATYDITLTPSGFPSVSDTGKTLIVFKKQPDGKWLRVVDAWSSNLPAK